MPLDYIFGHFNVLYGAVDRKYFFDVLFIDVSCKSAHMNLGRTGWRSRSALPTPDKDDKDDKDDKNDRDDNDDDDDDGWRKKIIKVRREIGRGVGRE